MIDAKQKIRQELREAGEKRGVRRATPSPRPVEFLHTQAQGPEGTEAFLFQKEALPQKKNPPGRPVLAALPQEAAQSLGGFRHACSSKGGPEVSSSWPFPDPSLAPAL